LSTNNEHLLSEERHYRIISEWEYYAVVTLLETNVEYLKVETIAEKLEMKQERAQFVIDTLLAEKIIGKTDNGVFQKNVQKLTTSKDVPSGALRKAHQEILEIAGEKLEKIKVEDRFYSASTIAIKKQNLDDAKELIREFRGKLSKFIAGDGPDEVYQMNIQLFPLSTLTQNNQETNNEQF
jgi:uncharacterized protein (TIGR02147 family)